MTVNEIITNQIIDRIEKAKRTGETFEWVKPFGDNSCVMPVSYEQSRNYTGINRLLLPADEYCTAQKASDLGCHIRKGSHGFIVVYFNLIPEKDENGEVLRDKDGNEMKRGFLKYYRVFSRQDIIDQTGENLPSKFPMKHYDHKEMDEQLRKTLLVFVQMFQAYCTAHNIQIEIIKDGTEAYFMPSKNIIRIPSIENLKSVYAYISTVAHEMIHSTMIPLNRQSPSDVKTVDERKEQYSKEELVAELGACFILQSLACFDDRPAEQKENNIAYLDGWSSYLKDKKNEIISASAKAQEASDFILDYAKEIEKEIEPQNDIKEAR